MTESNPTLKISDLAREAGNKLRNPGWDGNFDELIQSAINEACKPLVELADWALKQYSDCAQRCGYGGWDVEEFERHEQVLTDHRKEHGE